MTTDTATFLRAFGQRVAMFVARQHLQESYDYDSAGYLQLMLARGALLVQVLHEADKQGKTVVWLEPDFRYAESCCESGDDARHIGRCVVVGPLFVLRLLHSLLACPCVT